MTETLLSSTRILLFGRVVEDLKITPTAETAEHPTPLEAQLRAEGANFARIYAYSHDGMYQILPRPALFLVQGPGQAVAEVLCGADGVTPLAGLRSTSGEDGALPFTPDVRVWSCDRGDHSIRLDLQTGLLDQLLQSGSLEQKGMSVSGMSITGMSVSGMSVSGMSITPPKPRDPNSD